MSTLNAHEKQRLMVGSTLFLTLLILAAGAIKVFIAMLMDGEYWWRIGLWVYGDSENKIETVARFSSVISLVSVAVIALVVLCWFIVRGLDKKET